LEEFHFEPGRPIYTDGSAVHVCYPEIACASAAAFQVDSEGKHRLLTVQCDSRGPQSAIAGEALAVELATYGLSRALGPPVATPLVADCQAVVQSLELLPKALHYKNRFAGHFTDGTTKFLQPIKIKAHMSEAAAATLGLQQHWFGNDKADRFANEARASTGTAGKQYIEHQKTAFANLLQMTSAAASLPPVVTRPNRKVSTAIAASKALPDAHSFVRTAAGWLCIECGVRPRAGIRRHNGCSHAARVTHQIHATHNAFVAFHEVDRTLTPVYFCTRCGAHSTSRVASLRYLCLPRLTPTAAIKHLTASRHPRTQRPLMAVRPLPAQRESRQAPRHSEAPAASAEVHTSALDEYDGELQAAFELGLHSGFDSD
jgi:hypothetical protein